MSIPFRCVALVLLVSTLAVCVRATSAPAGTTVSAAPPAQVPVTPAAATASSDYQVGPGDLLHIAVFDHPEFSLDARVTQSGMITFPPLGQLAVGGKSTRQLEEMLTQGLNEEHYVAAPQVSVMIAEFQSQTVAVMGQVVRPGQYALQRVSRVLDVLAQAGGVINPVAVGEQAAGEQAVLVRKDGARIMIDLKRLFDGDPTQNPAVLSGDSLYVPRAPQFYIYGEVQRPGVYRLESHMTVAQAISEGGGLTPKGSDRRVMVKRLDPQGKELRAHVNSGDVVRPDDVLLVKQGWF